MERERRKQLNVVFSGHVQGVGFRFTAKDMAARLAVTGWVKNLPDGRVELLAQGQADDIDRLIDGLLNTFSVREKTVVESNPSCRYETFTITY